MLESLEPRAYKLRRTDMSPEDLSLQLNATKYLVKVLHERLMKNETERGHEPDWPKEEICYDAFFTVPGQKHLVLEINSVGSPDEKSNTGLFLSIYDLTRGDGEEEVIGLQTPKLTSMVDREGAEWLSRYSPEQLEKTADIVERALPISREEFNKKVPLRLKHISPCVYRQLALKYTCYEIRYCQN